MAERTLGWSALSAFSWLALGAGLAIFFREPVCRLAPADVPLGRNEIKAELLALKAAVGTTARLLLDLPEEQHEQEMKALDAAIFSFQKAQQTALEAAHTAGWVAGHRPAARPGPQPAVPDPTRP